MNVEILKAYPTMIDAETAKAITSKTPIKDERLDIESFQKYQENVEQIYLSIRIAARAKRDYVDIRINSHDGVYSTDPTIIKELFQSLGYRVYARRYRIGTPKEFTKLTIMW
jgi:effector-binding domain-containing protein